MSFLMVGGMVALGVFFLSFVRSGRFGSTILAFGAGYLLATLWTDALAGNQLVEVPYVSWRDAVFMGFIFVPGVLTLLFGHKKKSALPRVVAALAIALFVVSLTLPLFDAAPPSHVVYGSIEQYREVIISALLVIGIFDVAFARPLKVQKPSKD